MVSARVACSALVVTTIVAFSAGCAQDANREAEQRAKTRQARREALRERGTVRVITHPTHPMILYVTTLPDRQDGREDEDPKVVRFSVVDLSTGQWRDLDLAEQLRTRFGLERPRLFLEVTRTANELIVSRD